MAVAWQVLGTDLDNVFIKARQGDGSAGAQGCALGQGCACQCIKAILMMSSSDSPFDMLSTLIFWIPLLRLLIKGKAPCEDMSIADVYNTFKEYNVGWCLFLTIRSSNKTRRVDIRNYPSALRA